MDERLRFVARPLDGERMTTLREEFGISRSIERMRCGAPAQEVVAAVYSATTGPKCRFANARPEPDFKYFSKRTAACWLGNSIMTTSDHGRNRTVCPHLPSLCHPRRS